MAVLSETSFAIVNVVWGVAYTDLFLRFALPSQLFPGNLPALAQSVPATYRIYTTREDAVTILSSPVYAELTAIMPVEFVDIDSLYLHDESLPHNGKYNRMSACHHHFINTCARDKTALVFLSPDALVADGSFAKLPKLVAEGKKLILATGLRVSKESLIPELLAQYSDSKGLTTVAPRQLVELAVAHLHPDTGSYLWGQAGHNGWPCAIIKQVGAEGFTLRSFHLHPLLIKGEMLLEESFDSIDGKFMNMAYQSPDTVHFMTDSDELCACDLTSINERTTQLQPGQLTPSIIADWARSNACQAHRNFIHQTFRFHTSGISANWLEEERFFDKLIGISLALIELPDKPQSAYEIFQDALSINLEDTLIYQRVGDAFAKLGDYPTSRKSYSKAIQCDNGNTRAHIQLGNLARNDRNFMEAARHFLAAHKKAPDDPEVLNAIKTLSIEMKAGAPS